MRRPRRFAASMPARQWHRGVVVSDNVSGLVTGSITPARNAVDVPAQSEHAVQLMSPYVRCHQAVSYELGVGVGYMYRLQHGNSEPGKRFDIERNPFPSMIMRTCVC